MYCNALVSMNTLPYLVNGNRRATLESFPKEGIVGLAKNDDSLGGSHSFVSEPREGCKDVDPVTDES